MNEITSDKIEQVVPHIDDYNIGNKGYKVPALQIISNSLLANATIFY